MKTRAQTATEYLIILAVVIVIALIVVGVLGGIPSIGGGASESASRAALSSAEVGITGYSISPAKGFFRLQNNQANAIIVDSITIDGKECWLIGTNSQPSLTPRLRAGETKTISCGSITAESGDRYDYELSLTYTDTSTNAQYTITDLQMVGSGASFDCPTGFIPVPGGFVLADGTTAEDFCVMKYEAKAWNTSSDSVEPYASMSGDNWADGQPIEPRSVPEGRPWIEINQTNAIAECQSLGSGYDLISDQQWMVLAENILNTNINDLNASEGGPQLSNGLSSMSASAQAVADPDLSECYPEYSLDASENDNCGLRGTQGYNGTVGAWSQSYNPSGDGRSDLRIHMLSNGEVVWDIAGNVYQWTSTVLSGTSNGWSDYTSSINYTNQEWMEPSQKYLATESGMGRLYTSSTSDRVAVRGGTWNFGVSAGVFAVGDFFGPSDADSLVGFRCVYSPGG